MYYSNIWVSCRAFSAKSMLRWRSSLLEPITSSSNSIYKNFIATKSTKHMKTAGLVMLEGHRMVVDALSFGLVPHSVYVSPRAFQAPLGNVLRSELLKVPQTHFLSEDLMKRASDTEHSQGVVGLFHQMQHSFASPPSLCIICDGIQDPGNMGSIIRTAYGMGANAVFTVGGVSCWNAKAVRSSMGTVLRFPVISSTWNDIIAQLSPSTMYLLADGAGGSIWELQHISKPVALVVGAEATGISKEGFNACSANSKRVAIPMIRKDVESLNVAIAAGILMSEIIRLSSSPVSSL